MKLSVVIPVFRGKTILPELFKKIAESLKGKYDFEVLFVCDGCDYESKKTVESLESENQIIIRAFYLDRNYGQQRALQFGIGRASGDFIVTIDEDLQHDPVDIIELVQKQEEGNYDVVYGNFTDLRHKGIRNSISGILRKVLKYLIPTLYEYYSPYRLINREIAYKVSTTKSPFTVIDDMLGKITKNMASVNIRHHHRLEGSSSYSIFSLIKFGVLLIITYSKIIQLFFIAGGILITIGIILILLYQHQSLDYFPELFNYEILLFTGLILLIMGTSGIIIKYLNKRRNSETVQLLL